MASAPPCKVRIIGGRWRGRKLQFPAAITLRPTPDRVRETLFNWLQPWIADARCLDLFAGSGALGLEAASRGARRVVMVENDTRVAAQLSAHLTTLQASQAEVVCADSVAYLRGTPEPFDIVFLDPPYRQGLLAATCGVLAAGGWLARGAHIYLESEAALADVPLPPGWRLLRSKRAGQVHYGLAAAQ